MLEGEIIEGIVERCAASLCGHGDHGFYVLLKGRNEVFGFPPVREAYSAVHDRPSSSNDMLVSLMSPDDHISFEWGTSGRIKEKSLRNWTLEQRLSGVEKDITPIRPNVGLIEEIHE